jgi:hypothetical protein
MTEGPNYEINVPKSSIGSRITITNPLKRMSETSLNDTDLIAVSFITKMQVASLDMVLHDITSWSFFWRTKIATWHRRSRFRTRR